MDHMDLTTRCEADREAVDAEVFEAWVWEVHPHGALAASGATSLVGDLVLDEETSAKRFWCS
jgi:hypothetical protein